MVVVHYDVRTCAARRSLGRPRGRPRRPLRAGGESVSRRVPAGASGPRSCRASQTCRHWPSRSGRSSIPSPRARMSSRFAPRPGPAARPNVPGAPEKVHLFEALLKPQVRRVGESIRAPHAPRVTAVAAGSGPVCEVAEWFLQVRRTPAGPSDFGQVAAPRRGAGPPSWPRNARDRWRRPRPGRRGRSGNAGPGGAEGPSAQLRGHCLEPQLGGHVSPSGDARSGPMTMKRRPVQGT
ncbi:hypothetical protein JO379_005682 [Streptomyces syringium]|uniref:Uncharacterized protein n=1 Tax=Streptomyces syringium TaxID=76729 RepID=A0ABS4YE99_9ACTN|nr:hypothetical protein [Streptomyces syringium]